MPTKKVIEPDFELVDDEESNTDENVVNLPERTEVERIEPLGETVKLESGLEVDVQPLKLRQFLKLLKVVTTGAGAAWSNFDMDLNNPDKFVNDLLALVLFAIPESEDEVVEFIQSVVLPHEMPKGSDRATLERRVELVNDMYIELENPEPEDVITILEVLISREAEDIRKLGKRLAGMMATARKMGIAPKA